MDPSGFDYAALAERARRAREARAAARRRHVSGEFLAADVTVARVPQYGQTPLGNGAAMTRRPGVPSRQIGDAPQKTVDERTRGIDALADGASDLAEHTLGQGIVSATWPVVEEVFRVAESFATLTADLAREIAAFCSDPAIRQSGRWEARIPLDQRAFANTTLHLQLSQFDLVLRFDAADAATRQLLCDHSSSLERELRKLMLAWGEPRDIELTVW